MYCFAVCRSIAWQIKTLPFCPFHKASYTAMEYLQRHVHKSSAEHIHSLVFLYGYRKYVDIPAICTGCSSCLSVSLLIVERLQHLTGQCIRKSQLYIHKSVYANRHGAVHLYNLTGKPFMKLSCSKLVRNVRSFGQIAPICVWMCNWLCDGKSYLNYSNRNDICVRATWCTW